MTISLLLVRCAHPSHGKAWRMATKLPAPLRLLRRDTSHALRFMRGWFVRHGNPAAAIVFALFAGLFFLVPLDSAVIATVAESKAARPGLCECARLISYFGDFLGFNLILFVGLQVAGCCVREDCCASRWPACSVLPLRGCLPMRFAASSAGRGLVLDLRTSFAGRVLLAATIRCLQRTRPRRLAGRFPFCSSSLSSARRSR